MEHCILLEKEASEVPTGLRDFLKHIGSLKDGKVYVSFNRNVASHIDPVHPGDGPATEANIDIQKVEDGVMSLPPSVAIPDNSPAASQGTKQRYLW